MDSKTRIISQRTLVRGFGIKRPWVRIPQSGPNKVDSFDTRVSETIDLFLFTKMPVAIHIFMIYSNIIQ